MRLGLSALLIVFLFPRALVGQTGPPLDGFLPWSPEEIRAFRPFSSTGVNPCPDGQFRDLGASPETVVCRNRDRESGFSREAFEAAFPDRVLEPASCDDAVVRAAVSELGAGGGGTLRLPACTLQLTTSLALPDRVVLEGAGVGETIVVQPSTARDGIVIWGASHVAVRDLTLEGGSTPLFILYSYNVLIERIEIRNGLRNGLHFGYSRNITIRYSLIHDQQNQNGLSTKDCYPESVENFKCGSAPAGEEREACLGALIVTEALCEETIRAVAANAHGRPIEPGSVWTTGYAVYSNFIYDNLADYGLALHGVQGEVAGNWILRNRRGAKFPDSRDVLIHHNHFQESIFFGLHLYAIIEDRFPVDARIYANRIVGNGEFAMRLEGVRDIYLINNRYSSNNQCYESCWDPPGFGVNSLRIDTKQIGPTLIAPAVFVCPGDQDALLDVRGYPPGLAPADLCALSVGVDGPPTFPLPSAFVFPNPASTRATVVLQARYVEVRRAALTDQLGRVVRDLDPGFASAPLRFDVGLRDLSSGVYFVRLETDTGLITLPLFIAH